MQEEKEGPDRLAELERRLSTLEGKGRAASLGDRVERALKFLPLFAVGNLLVGVPAVMISIAVAYFSFVQAEATEKMQVAAVWPRATYVTSNQDGDGEGPIRLSLVNHGVGPALIRGLRIEYDGRAYVDFQQLLSDCCTDPDGPVSIAIGSINGEVLRPGEETMFAMLMPDGTPPEVFERFNRERLNLRVSLCYCSVFEDCWIESWELDEPEQVAQCPSDWTQYTGFPQALAPPS